MKEKIISAAIIAAGIVVLGLCLKSGIDNYVNKDRIVSVKGLAEKDVEANVVTWNLSVSASGDDLQSLYSEVGRKADVVKAFLKKNGVKDDEISTTVPNVSDRSGEYYEDPKVKRDRYYISIGINVLSNDVKKIQKAASNQGDLISEGIVIDNEYEPISYDYTGFSEVKPEMMKEAIANAQKTGEQFAENSKSELDKIITADQGQFSIDAIEGSMPYMKRIRVVTTITYSLKN